MPDVTIHPQTQGGRLLARGYTFDPECHRTTHRLSVARALLRSQGVEPTFPEHESRCMLSPSQRFNRLASWSYSCDCGVGSDPRPTWPEWVDGEVFDAAYRLADRLQTKRGEWHRAEASREKTARERVEA